jgi:hypothetical protein
MKKSMRSYRLTGNLKAVRKVGEDDNASGTGSAKKETKTQNIID